MKKSGKTWHVTDAGRLFLLPWSFLHPDAQTASGRHRNRLLCSCKIGKSEISLTFNPYAKYWVLSGVGPGFAGDRSKAINTLKTKSEPLAALWRAAIEAGNIEMLERT